MDWVDIAFPPRIALGAQRRPSWNTTLAQAGNGRETTNQNWSRVRHTFELSLAIRTATDYDDVVQHFHTMRGRARKFPFRDILDYKVTAARGTLLEGEDSPSTAYYLAKRYGTSPYHYDRRITRPAAGTVRIYRTRSGVITDITSSCAIDTSTGGVDVTAGVVVSGDTLSWAGQFWVPCRYDVDELPGVITNRRPGGGELLVSCDSIPVVEVRE